MRLHHVPFAVVLTTLPATATANDLTEIWNGTSGTLVVRDNGVVVCQTPPVDMFGRDMADGFHRVEVTGFNGVTLHLEGAIPGDDFMSAFSGLRFHGRRLS